MRQIFPILTLWALVATSPASAEIRALWITRWDYRTEADVAAIAANAAGHGFNTILFQVRGDGTVFYPSQVEPWAWELTGDSPVTTGQAPGWDPLRTAIREAHRHGLQIHAYLNSLPGWRGTVPAPKQSGQLWSVHPDWFMVDAAGKRMQPYATWYTFLSPHRPDVQSHLRRLVAEVAEKYDVDGLHLDYFRFPADYQAKKVYPKAGPAQLAKHKDFSYDQVALQRFRESTGTTPSQSPEAWDQFRRDTLTGLLSNLRAAALEKRPRLVISASVIADPTRARQVYFQDSPLWLAKGLLDMAFPMNYRAQTFDSMLSAYCTAAGERLVGRVAVGISLAHPARELRRQIALAKDRRTAGIALFAYSSIFKNHKPGKKAGEIKQILLAQP